VHVLGDRTDAVVGEAAKRLRHELEVVREVVRARAVNRDLVAQTGKEGR
jgi:hypothetical protein